MGLGFDFARIECVGVGRSGDSGGAGDAGSSGGGKELELDGTFTVDGKPPRGWDVSLFEVEVAGSGTYVGVAAQCTGGDRETVTRRVGTGGGGEGEGGCKVVEIEADVFLRRAVRGLMGEECAV